MLSNYTPLKKKSAAGINREECRTKAVVEEFSECLMSMPCTYGFPFGNTYFCKHPRHLEFSKNRL
jgi:hypothetical protein